jgi:hypothetical protein
MEQTFNDLLRERAEEERGLFGFILWVFVETTAEIIKENITFIIMQNNTMQNKNIIRNIIRVALATAFILLIPLLAMQFTDEVVWTLSDFAIMGTLLFDTGLAYELATWKVSNIKHRVAIGVAFLAALLLVWADLAVGIFNIPGISGS